MLAAVYYGPQDLRVEEHPLPAIAPGEALLKVRAAGICGTDLRIYHGVHRKFPPGTVRVPGHEVVGEVASLGNAVQGFKIGERVFFAPNWGCGQCKQCVSGNHNLCANYDAVGINHDGAFAQYMRVPAAPILQGCMFPVSERIDPAVAALIEPFACVLRGQDALHIQPGETVLVIGAGPIGLMHVLLAKLRGAGEVILSEVNPERLQRAKELGVSLVVNPSTQDLAAMVAEHTGGLGVDAAIVAAPSHAAMEQALDLLAIQGRLCLFAGLPKDHPVIQFNANLVHYKEIKVTGTTACSAGDCRRAAAVIASGRIDLSGIVGLRFPLSRAVEAFKAAEAGHSLKVILEP
jgi:L-iditol 2-dehydrogenase